MLDLVNLISAIANVYSNGVSEKILGKAIKKYNFPRGKIVIATKLYGVCSEEDIAFRAIGFTQDQIERDNGYLNYNGLSRKHIFDSVEASLRRLDLDYIDLLQIHRLVSERWSIIMLKAVSVYLPPI